MTPLLLPLRIETRFHPTPEFPTALKIRVIPDEPWFDDHAPEPTEAELADLRAWENAETSTQRQARWQRLVDRRGLGRARWLVRRGSDGTGTDVQGRWRQIVGLPSQLDVWLLPDLDGLEHTESGPRIVLRPNLAAIDLDLPDSDPDTAEGERWWNSFRAAEDVGLAGTVPLSDEDRARLPFDALVVVGVGDTPADGLFAAHRDAGKLAVLTPGQPTNTVEGAPTPARRDDDASEPLTPPTPSSSGPLQRLAQLLLGDAHGLDEAPASSPSVAHEVQGAVISALWPALWGHGLGNFWRTGDAVVDLASWAMEALRPEGPLPPIRIDDQPYGILPVAPLARLQAHDAFQEPASLLSHVVPRLSLARGTWLRAADGEGTVEGASAEQLLDLAGRAPVSHDIWWRKVFPYDLLFADTPAGPPPLPHAEAWHDLTDELTTFGIVPWRRLASVYSVRGTSLPRVIPVDGDATIVAEALRNLVEPLVSGWDPGAFADGKAVADRMGSDASVFLRLARSSLQLALADEGRRALGEPGPTLDAILQLRESNFVAWIEAAPPQPADSPTGRMIAALQRLADLIATEAEGIDRGLRGALDAASHRLDTWLSAPATRRLDRVLRSAAVPSRLGAYGWVEGLAPGGGGPTLGGAVLAPSQDQAKTAAILRERHLRDPDPGRFAMNVTGRKARLAKQLAEQVRSGLHPTLALGLEIETLVDDPVRIEDLRRRFPARRSDGGRRVCDGLRVLEEARTSGNLWPDFEGFAVTERIRTHLADLVDVYADLLVAQSVHHVVQGRGQLAGAALDAAAGLSIPPSLEVLPSPVEARHLRTVVVAILPVAPPGTTPAERADPHVAQLLDRQFGTAPWTWSFVGRTQGQQADTTVALSDLGLTPSSAACLSGPDLEEVARGVAAEQIAISLGVPRHAVAMERSAAPGSASRTRMGRFVRALGSRPFTVADLSSGGAEYDARPEVQRDRERIGQEALERVLECLSDLDTLLAGLTTAEPLLGATLEQLRRWGLPAVEPTGGLAYAANLRRRHTTASTRLEEALTASAQDDDPAVGPPASWRLSDWTAERVQRLLSKLPLPDLCRLLTDLVAPHGEYAISNLDTGLARTALPELLDAGEEVRDWISSVAPVQPALAATEAAWFDADLAGEPPPTLRCSRPTDPWQLGQLDQLGAPPLVVVLVHDGADLDGPVAMLLIDRFAELVPEPERPAAVAFGFDAPASRSPQAFLVAVPPTVDEVWQPSSLDLLEVVLEARALARVRSVQPTNDAIAGLASFLPTALVPQHGPAAVELEVEDA
ncbi:MAG: hypothetical protein AAGA48_35955 [Myxococcota bacterium]